MDNSYEVLLTSPDYDDRSQLKLSPSVWGLARQLGSRHAALIDSTGPTPDQVARFLRNLKVAVANFTAETDEDQRALGELQALVTFVENSGRRGFRADMRLKSLRQPEPSVATATPERERRTARGVRRGLTADELQRFTVKNGQPKVLPEQGVVLVTTGRNNEGDPVVNLLPSQWARIRKLAHMNGFAPVGNPDVVRPHETKKFHDALKRADPGDDEKAVKAVLSVASLGKGLKARLQSQ